MICEHKRESRSTASSSLDPVAAPGTCPESSWPASLPSPISHPPSTRRHWATASVFTTTRSLCALRPSRGRQSVEPLLTSVECLPPHSFTHDSRQTPPELGVSLSPSPPLFLSLPLFLFHSAARFSIVFAAILLPAAPLTAAPKYPTPYPPPPLLCLVLPLSPVKGIPTQEPTE